MGVIVNTISSKNVTLDAQYFPTYKSNMESGMISNTRQNYTILTYSNTISIPLLSGFFQSIPIISKPELIPDLILIPNLIFITL